MPPIAPEYWISVICAAAAGDRPAEVDRHGSGAGIQAVLPLTFSGATPPLAG